MKSCRDCLYSQRLIPSFFYGEGCDIVCEIYGYEDKQWIVNHPILRALFCQNYYNRDKYMRLKKNCFWTCKKGKTIKCPPSSKCLAIGRPYFELKEEYKK